MNKLDIRLYRMIGHSKGQFISVAIIVVVALSIFICFSTSNVNIREAIKNFYDETNFSHINVELMKISQKGIKEIKSIKGIKEVQGRISIDVPLETDNKDEKVILRLISVPDDDGINRLHMPGGEKARFKNNNLILLRQFALDRDIEKGDIITPYINGRIHNMEVSNIAYSPEFVYLMESEQSLMPAAGKFGVAFVGEEFAQGIYGDKGYYNEVLITLKNEDDMDEVVEVLENTLDKYGIKRITKRENQISNRMLTEKLEGFDKISKVLPVLFFAVAGIVISIMLSRIVSNDRMAIGVLKALGYSDVKVLFHYLKYSLMIGTIGSIIGIVLGLILSKMLTELFILYFNIPLIGVKIQYIYILYSVLLTGVFCIISGLLGAWRVLKITPADAMLPEPPKSGKHILLERIGFVWKKLTFSWKVVIKNILRNKRRFALLVLGLALAYSINTVPQYMLEAVTAMFSVQYGEYQKMDFTVDFKRPMNEGIIKDLKHLVGTKSIEPRIEYPFELRNGLREKAVNIIGAPVDTSFLEFKDLDNNSVKLSDKGIFITEALSKLLNVKKGEKITIKNFLPGREDVMVEVDEVVRQYLGMNAYMNIGFMQNKLVDKKMITGAALNSGDNVREKLKDVKNISSVMAVEDFKKSFEEYLDIVVIVTRLYMIFGGILSFVLIYNSTIISISERRLELASLRVMGFDKIDIFKMLVKENCIIAIFAIFLGIPFGIGMIRGMAEAFSSDIITFPIILSHKTFITAGAATVLFAVIAQVATWRRVRDLDFIEALKSRIS